MPYRKPTNRQPMKTLSVRILERDKDRLIAYATQHDLTLQDAAGAVIAAGLDAAERGQIQHI